MSRLGATILGPPLAVWAAAYLALALHFRRAWLGSVAIHETGRLTLVQTIFYWNHFLRELPIATLYALAAFWSVRVVAPEARVSTELAAPLGWGLFGFLALAVAGSVRCVGWSATWLDLLQYRDRDDQRQWGGHWQMHFLSTLGVVLLLMLPGLLVGGGAPRLGGGLLAAIAALSIVFRAGRRALADVRWLLHGGREILTFGCLAVVPLYLALSGDLRTAGWSVTPSALAALALLAALAVYYLRVLATTSLATHSEAASEGALYLVASHFFEHCLDVLFMLLLMALLLSHGG